MNIRPARITRPLSSRILVPRVVTGISALATILIHTGKPEVRAGDFLFDNGGVTIADATTTNVAFTAPNIWNPDGQNPTGVLDSIVINATAFPGTANPNTVLNIDIAGLNLSNNGILHMGGSGTNPNNVLINFVSSGAPGTWTLPQFIKSGGGTIQIAPEISVNVQANPVNNPMGNLHLVNTDDSQIQFQGLLTVAGDVIKNGTGGGSVRFGTSGSTFNNAIAGNIIVNGGAIEFASSTGNTAAGGGRAVIMNAPAGTINFRSMANVDYEREIDLHAYFTTISTDRATGTTLTSQVASTGVINVMRNDAYLQVNSGNSFGFSFDGINLGANTLNIRNGLNNTAGLATTGKALVGALSGSGTIHVSGNGDNNTSGVNFNLPSPNFSGLVRFYEAAGHLITATGSLGSGRIILGTDQTFAPVTLPNPSLGSSTPTVRNQPWSAMLAYNANNPTTAPVGVTAFAGSQVNMGVVPTATDVIELKPFGIIQGDGLELAGFTVGTNLILPPQNAIISHEAVGGADPVGLPLVPTHFYGISANLSGTFTVGAGTPWKGLSNDRFARNILAGSSIVVNGGDTNPNTIEATLLGVYGKTFQIFAGGGSWMSGSGQPVTIEIAGATNNFGNLNASAGLGGTVYFMSDAASSSLNPSVVDKIRVSANLQAQGANMFGGVPVEVVAGGGIDPGNTLTFDTNVTFRSGARMLHNDAMLFTGTGTLTFESGSHFYITGSAPTNTLTASTQPITFAGTNHHLRIGVNDILELDLRVPDAGAVFELNGGPTTNPAGTTLTGISTNTQSAGLSTDGGIITNDTANRALVGPVVVGNAGATFAATTNTRLVLMNAIVAGVGAGAGGAPIQIGSANPINSIGKTANEVALTNNFATLNAYNGVTGIIFENGLKSGPINVIASDLYLDGPAANTKITGDIILGANSRLYLGDGGDIATGNALDAGTPPRRGDLTPLLVSNVPGGNVTTGAQGVVFGQYSRIEMGVDFTDPDYISSTIGGRGQINQPFVIPDNTELNPQDRRSFWVNRVGGVAAPVEFNSITVGNNANIAFQENGLDVRATIRMAGATAIASPGNGSSWDFKNLVNVGGGAKTLQLGRLDQPLTEYSVYGNIDPGIGMRNVRGRLAIRDGAVIPAGFTFVDDADARQVFNFQATTPAGTTNGTDHTLSLVRGSDGNPANYITEGTFTMNKPNAWGAYVQDSGFVALRNEITSPMVINSGGGTLFVDRDGADSALNGTVRFGVVALNAPNVTLATRNLVDLEVGTLAITQNAVIRVDGSQDDGAPDSANGLVRIKDVAAGTNSVHFQNGRTTITGNVAAGALVAGGIELDFNPGAATQAHNVASVQVNSLLTASSGATNFGNAKIRSSAPGTLIAGLREGKILGGGIDTATVNPASDGATANQLNANNLGIRLDPRMGLNNASTGGTGDPGRGWGDNQTFVYTGQIFDADGIFTLAEQIDDSVEIKIDGNRVLFSRNTGTPVGGTGLSSQAPFDTWRTATNTSTKNGYSDGYKQPISGNGDVGSGLGDLTVHNVNEFGGVQNFGMGALGDGWHEIEIRMHNGGGGAGPHPSLGWGNYFGIGLNSGATTSHLGTDYSKPMDNGTMNLFRTPVVARGNVNIDSGATLASGGFDGIGGIAFSGAGNGIAQINDTGANFASTADALIIFPSATGTLAIQRPGDSLTAGFFRGDGNFTKTGPGSLSIPGTNAIATGTTFTVSGGRLDLGGTGSGGGALVVDGATSIASINGSIAGSATVQNGGRLQGDGSIAGFTLVTGGSISAGNGVGSLDVNIFVLTNAATFAAEINGTGAGTGYDQLIVGSSGSVDLGGAALSLSGTYNLGASGDVFTLLLNNSATPIVGEFAGLANGSTVSLAGQPFRISYFDDAATPGFELAGGGNDISLLAIPEPGSATLLLGGLGSLLAVRRRRSA